MSRPLQSLGTYRCTLSSSSFFRDECRHLGNLKSRESLEGELCVCVCVYCEDCDVEDNHKISQLDQPTFAKQIVVL